MKRTLIYIALTFALSWGAYFAAGITLGTFESGVNSSVPMIAIVAASMFFPIIAALVTNRIVAPEERIDLGLHPHLKGNLRVYLMAWLAPVAYTLAGCVVFFLAFPQLFDPTLSAFRETAAAAGTPIGPDTVPALLATAIASALLVAPLINMIPALGEEAGWRGMLYPSLLENGCSKRSAIIASGVIWGIWHAPVIAMGHNYGMDYPGFPLAGIATMTLTCTCFGAFLAWLRDRSESAWPCALAHGSFNAVANIGTALCAAPASVLGPSPLALVAGIPLIVVGVAFIVRA